MAFLLIAPDRDTSELSAHLRALEPGLDLRVWPDIGAVDDIKFALAWKPPAGAFAAMHGLIAVSSLGAGVDHLIGRDDLPDHVALTRLAGPRLAADLSAYLVAMTVDWWKRLDEQRHASGWDPLEPRPAPRIGLLGTGRMGRAAVRAFQALELDVKGWNRSGRAIEVEGTPLTVHHGPDGLKRLAGESDVLINLLPLTADTRSVLNAALFEAMPGDSLLINAGRGEQLDEAALLAALDAGRPGRAVLDVFASEPLPDDHPLRQHAGIVITPHIGGRTDPAEAAALAIEQWRCIRQGRPLPDTVDRMRGY